MTTYLISKTNLFYRIGLPIIMGIVAYLGVSAMMNFLLFDNLRTEEECNALEGVMDDPEWLEAFPDEANTLKKDNCLAGLKIINTNRGALDLLVFFILFIPLITMNTTMRDVCPIRIPKPEV